MHAIKRHALGLGVLLFLAGAFLTVAPVTKSGFGCGSTMWPKDDTVRQVEVVTPDGQAVLVDKPEDVDARQDCHHKRQTQTTVAVALGLAGLIGVFWSVVAAPETSGRRSVGRI